MDLFTQWYEYNQLFIRADIMSILFSVLAFVAYLFNKEKPTPVGKIAIYGFAILTFVTIFVSYDMKKKITMTEKELIQKYGACETYKTLAKYYGEEYNWLYNKAYQYCELEKDNHVKF